MSIGTSRKPTAVTAHKVGRRAPSVKSGRSRHYVRTSDAILKTRVVDSGVHVSSTMVPEVKPQRTTMSAASRVKKVAKGFGLLVKPRFANKDNTSGKKKKFPWIVKESVTPDRISLPVLQSPLPSPTSLEGFAPSTRSSTSTETSCDEFTPAQRIAKRHSLQLPLHQPIAASPLAPTEATPAKAFRHKRKPVPAMPTEPRNDPDPMAYTSFIDFSIVETPEPVAAPLADATPSTTTPEPSGERTTGEGPLARPNNLTRLEAVAEVEEAVVEVEEAVAEVEEAVAEAEGDDSISPDTQPCVEVIADDATKQVALGQPPTEHSPQPLWPVLAKPPDRSLDIFQMINLILSFITQFIMTLIMVISDNLVNVRSGSSTGNRERVFASFHVGDDGRRPYSKKVD